MMDLDAVYCIDVLDGLKKLDDECIDCVVTSPPYWNLRDYGTAKWEGGNKDCNHLMPLQTTRGGRKSTLTSVGARECVNKNTTKTHESQYKQICAKCGARRVDNQIGLEKTPEEYVARLVSVFREVKRVLKKEGVVFLNLGDSYAGGGRGWEYCDSDGKQLTNKGTIGVEKSVIPSGLKHKDLVGVPWKVAFALQADGWWLRQDIIWCISGGTYVYAKTKNGCSPVMIRDLIRLKPETVYLWDGKKWCKILGLSKSKRMGNEIELVLRSGERLSCTPNHKFPTDKGILEAKNIRVGHILQKVKLPDIEKPMDCFIDNDAGWFAGLYIAEGSKSNDCIQIAGHSKETKRWERLQKIAKKYGGHITRTIDGNNMSIRMYGKILNALLNELVSGRTCKDKSFSPVVWQYSNKFIETMLDGYLSGDGHWDKKNNRWRLGFTRNYYLERDLRTACARLGYKIILNLSSVKYNGKRRPTFHGELRKEISSHHNNKNTSEVMEIRKARCREVYDIGIDNNSHLFSFASGVLSHNSKPNSMPESVTDRCTKSHEYIFLLSKSKNYYFDAESIKEPVAKTTIIRSKSNNNADRRKDGGSAENQCGLTPEQQDKYYSNITEDSTRNKRSVWIINTQPLKETHFATFPYALIEPMIKAGCPANVCKKCGKPQVRIKKPVGYINDAPVGVIKLNDKPYSVQERTGYVFIRDLPAIAEIKKYLNHWRKQKKLSVDEIEEQLHSQAPHHWFSGESYPSKDDWLEIKKLLGFDDKYDKRMLEGMYKPAEKLTGKHRYEVVSCGCDAGFDGGVVLDPFIGSGTTAIVARKLLRHYIGFELNPEYVKMAKKRLSAIPERLECFGDFVNK